MIECKRRSSLVVVVESLVSVFLIGLPKALGFLIVIPKLLGGHHNGDGTRGGIHATNYRECLNDIIDDGPYA